MIRLALVSHSPHLYGAEQCLINMMDLFHSNSKKIPPRKIQPILMIPSSEHEIMPFVARQSEYDMVYTPTNPWYIYQTPDNPLAFKQFCTKVREDIQAFKYLFKTVDADVVLVNTLTNFIPHMAAFELGLPIITWIHGVLDPEIIINQSYQSAIDKCILEISNHIIFNSIWTARQFEAYAVKDKSVVISNWTKKPLTHFPYNKTCRQFICLSSMEPKKGVHILVHAAKHLYESGCLFHVDLYGSGCEVPNILDQIQNNGLQNIVSLHEPTTDITPLYNECAALIQPSLHESFGRTIIEAMSYSRPVIAASTADPENIISDGIHGFRVPPNNSKVLAEKMLYILEHPKAGEKMGKKGYRHYKVHFDGRNAKKKLTKLICKTYFPKFSADKSAIQKNAFNQLRHMHSNK